uniref:Inhibitor of growth protein n=1 Tax=Sparus aurata TaxID=8175 RepID=A0A671X8P0_SPAAU
MLYLEDYLEMIEQLPMDLRDRFTEMREMDLQVQNATDQLEQKVIEFFVNAKKNKPEWREEQMEVIKKDYYKALEDADEKVQLANQIYDLVDRHLRKLDQELAKFKMELEADNAGITEILERRSLEMDSPSQPVNNHHVHSHTAAESKYTRLRYRLPPERTKCWFWSDSGLVLGWFRAGSGLVLGWFRFGSGLVLGWFRFGSGLVLGWFRAGSGLVQVWFWMKEGRRTSSLKASYEAIKNNDFQLGREFALSRDNTGYSSSALASTLTQTLTPTTASDSRGRKSKSSIKSSNHQSSSSSSSSSLSSCSSSSALAQELSQQASALPEAEANSQVDWTYDPNEPRYCICNQVSYGEMVGCDNTDCPIEWFHYGCVGLTEAPKGKWYCPQCTAAMKRRGSRHK